MSEIDLNPLFEQLKKLDEKVSMPDDLGHLDSEVMAALDPARARLAPVRYLTKKSAGGETVRPKPVDWFCTYCGGRNNGIDNHCLRCQADKR